MLRVIKRAHDSCCTFNSIMAFESCQQVLLTIYGKYYCDTTDLKKVGVSKIVKNQIPLEPHKVFN